MEIEGKIIEILDLKSGTTINGKEWKSQEFILETEEQYSKKVCFSLFGDKIESNPVKINQVHQVSFDLASREYNGRWYTEAKAWRVAPITGDIGVSRSPNTDMPFLPPDNEGDSEHPF
jgi:hypothetical protein